MVKSLEDLLQALDDPAQMPVLAPVSPPKRVWCPGCQEYHDVPPKA